MKKFLAFLLVCALLLPALSGCAVSAADGEKAAIKPFCGVGGTEVYDSDLFTNVRNYSRVNIIVEDGAVYVSRTGCGRDIKKIAADIKADMDSRPEGMRYLQIFGTRKAFAMSPEEVIYLDKGVDLLKEVLTDLMKEYYEIGGTLTGVILDLEYIGLSNYYLSQDLQEDPTLLERIVAHPNYATEIRPLLEAYDFAFYPSDGGLPEIYGVYDKSGSAYDQARMVWDMVMKLHLNRYQEESCVEPVWTYFPDALINDYQGIDAYAWSKMPSDNGAKNYLGGNRYKVGNVSNYSSYANRPAEDLYYKKGQIQEYRYPESFNGVIYENTPFNMLKWDNHLFKTMYFDSDTHLISACICAYDYNGDREGGVANTPYYVENLYHIGLLDPEPFRVYVYAKLYDTTEEYLYRLSVISEVLDELTRVVGYADREPIVLPNNWNDSFVLSGMYAGGKNYWRITPDLSAGVTKETFLVADAADPTFRINGQTVTFPGGKIIEDTKISVTGTCGYWVETATNVVPVIENDADRYAQYPAFLIDYENYTAGTVLTSASALPANSWIITDPTKSVIAADPNNADNQLLAISGDVAHHNVLLPKNITAGDSYAKRQMWEITVILPESMGNGSLTLLNTNKIGGIRITADKVCYDENGEYVEFSDVQLSPGGKYTIQRELFFESQLVGEEECYPCNYYIYDAEGKLVAGKEGVAIKAFELPVAKVGFMCENMGKNTIYIDDFKMYAVGFHADFFLYKAENGMQLQDTQSARAGQTAYRYSWMNASDVEEKVQIVAQVLDTEGNVTAQTVIKELTMLPGCDGVETGIYDAKDTAVVFAVIPVAAEAQDSGLWLYVAIAAAAVIAIAAVAAIVILKKKKAV